MKYLTYLALVATVDARWTPLKDLKHFHKKHQHDLKEFAQHHQHPLKDASSWFGKEWKKISALKSEEQVKLDRIKLEEIVSGILKGALDAEGFDDINHCIADAEHVFTDAEAAYQDFKAGGASKIIDGMKELADLFQQVKAGMSDCSHLKADWDKLEKMVEIFSSPTSFAYHVGKDLIVNGADIFSEIESAVTDYQAAKWEDFGYQVGEAAAKTLLGGEKPVNESAVKVAQVTQGIIAAYGGHFNLEALLACIQDEDQALLVLDAAYQEFQQAVKDKSIGDVIGGVIATVAGIQSIKQGLPACKAIDTTSWDYNGFSRTTQMMSDPIAFFEPVAEDVLIHGVPILADTEKAVAAYKKGDYYGYGNALGKILENATGVREQWQAKPKAENVDREMAAKVASGLLSATQVGSFDFQALLICIYEADQSAEILDAAVQTFEEAYKDKSIEEAVGGAIATLAFVQQLKQTIPACEAVDPHKMNWTEFDKIVSTLEDPVTHIQVIENDVVMNGKTITKDFEDAVESFRAGEYVKFGQKWGNALYYATEDDKNIFLY